MAIATMRVPTLFTAVDKFSDVVSKMTRKTTMFGKSAEAAALRTSKKFNDVGNTMLGAGIGIATGIGFAVNEAGKFEKSISNISTLTENTPEQMKYIGDRILQISKTIPIAISDMTSGMYDVVSAGITGTANQLNVLDKSGRLAVAGLGTTKEAVNIMTSSLNAFGVQASESEKVANLLMKTVKYGKTTVSGISESFGAFASIMKNSNVTLEEYLASAAALTTTGMSMSRAQTQVSSATTALIKPNKTMSAIYEKLGVKDVPAFIKKSGGLVGALTKVDSVAKDMGISMSKVMGRKEGLSALLSLLGAQKGKFKEIMNDMASGADILNTAFAKQQNTLSAKIQRMKNQMTILAIRIGTVLIPKITELVNSIVPTIENFTKWTERNKWLSSALFTTAKWLLILGTTAKIVAFMFRGYAFALGIVTTLTEAYTFVNTMAALSNVTFGKALLSLIGTFGKYITGAASAATATLAMTGAIVGGVAVIGFGLYKLAQGFQNMYSKQDYALRQVSVSWQNTTFSIEKEINKQKKLIDEMQNPNTKNGYDATKLYNLTPGSTDAQKKIDYLSKYKNLPLREQQAALMRWNQEHIAKGTTYRLHAQNESPQNIAGSSSNNTMQDLKQFLASKAGKLDLNITAPDGYNVNAEGSVPSGIEVKTKPNQGSR